MEKPPKVGSCNHNWIERRILTTPPEDYIQIQVSASLKECDKCGKQECTYDDDEYNVL